MKAKKRKAKEKTVKQLSLEIVLKIHEVSPKR